jgi:hypothetical protein
MIPSLTSVGVVSGGADYTYSAAPSSSPNKISDISPALNEALGSDLAQATMNIPNPADGINIASGNRGAINVASSDPVPEPSSLSLLVSAILIFGFGWVVRRGNRV